jgi:GTP-binding protein
VSTIPETDALSCQVFRQTKSAIEEADVLVLVFDCISGLHPDDMELVSMARRAHKPFIAVINKVDTERQEMLVSEFFETGITEPVQISAKHGIGILSLLKKIRASLPRHIEETETISTDQVQESIRVAIIGRPNVGKSSMLNSLIGQPRMVVSDIPGTTRDSIDSLLERKRARDILFIDTAGIRKKAKVKKRLEKFSILKAIESIRTSDICVCIFDAKEGITDQDRRLVGYTAEYGKGCITVFNKWDLTKGDSKLRRVLNREALLLKKIVPYAPHINVSALTGKNINRLIPAIDQVYGDYIFTESTGRLNRILKQALLRRNPPVAKGHFLKIFYVTQTGTRPPTFTFFVNYPELFPEYYRRFLANFFRKELGISHSPAKIVLRGR